MIYLLEIDAYDPVAAAIVTLRYATAPYFTEAGDVPANADFEPRIVDPGNYERHVFSAGRTSGESDVGTGIVTLANPDGALDHLLGLGLDGRALRLFAVEDARTPWASRETVLVATMEQATFPSRTVEIRIRDRLALLREPILTQAYLGTTVSGGRADAEGGKDLKGTKKPRLFGRALNMAPVEVDAFDRIYQISSSPIASVAAVRDSMIPLTFASNVATLAALKALSLTGGQYATCLALGLVRVASRPVGALTVEASEGATLADRSAARIVQRMLTGIVPIVAADFDTLHSLAPAECGLWIEQSDRDILSAAQTALGSIGAFLTVDRFGAFRVGRWELPAGEPKITLDRSLIIDQGETLSRSVPGDDGDGLGAWKITLRYAFNDTVLSFGETSTAATAEARSFAEQEWRQVVVESAATKAAHPLAPELTFDTSLTTEADATAEANRRMTIYGVRRDLFSLVVPSDEVPTVDLGDVVAIAIDRFGMASGRSFRVLGLTATLARNLTTIDAWG